MMQNDTILIITGTDPESRRGGIGYALPGYLRVITEAGFDYLSIPTYHPSEKYGSWWWLLRSIPRLIKEIKKAKKKYTRVVVYSHAGAGVSLVREHVVLMIGRMLGAKCLLQLHAPEIHHYLNSEIQKLTFEALVSPANGLGVLTPWWKHRLEQANIKGKLSVIPNPLPDAWDVLARDSKAKSRSFSSEIHVLSMTRIEPGKGVDLVVQAMKFLPESISLTVAGDGSQLAGLKEYVRKNALAHRVRFTGWVGGDEKQNLISQADVFCLPSSLDSFGMGFVEAMANGLPVVALDWGPIADVVSNGQTGILVKDKDPKCVAAALEKMIPGSTREEMGLNAKTWVQQEFGSLRVADLISTAVANLYLEK